MNATIINTPNGVQGTPVLNKLSKKFRKEYFCTANIVNEGFELGFHGNWEWHINHKSGKFIVLSEDGADILGWYYKHSSDLQPIEFIIRGGNTSQQIKVIKNVFNKY